MEKKIVLISDSKYAWTLVLNEPALFLRVTDDGKYAKLNGDWATVITTPEKQVFDFGQIDQCWYLNGNKDTIADISMSAGTLTVYDEIMKHLDHTGQVCLKAMTRTIGSKLKVDLAALCALWNEHAKLLNKHGKA